MIVNIRQNNAVSLPDNNNGTPIVSSGPNADDRNQLWKIQSV